MVPRFMHSLSMDRNVDLCSLFNWHVGNQNQAYLINLCSLKLDLSHVNGSNLDHMYVGATWH